MFRGPSGADSRGSRTFALGAFIAVVCALAACKQAPPGEIEETPDEPRPREAQSDFLDIGKQAGIEWLSFVPNDQREYPELFEGLDRDQKRHLRLAPLERPDERVLIEFKLPQNTKLWPVDWYGTELMAIDLPPEAEVSGAQVSVAMGTVRIEGSEKEAADLGQRLAEARASQLQRKFSDKEVTIGGLVSWKGRVNGVGVPSFVNVGPKGAFEQCYGYCARFLRGAGRSTGLLLVLEYAILPESGTALRWPSLWGGDILAGISIRRDLALEGFPKHKCSSSVEDLQAGKLVFPGGTLSLPLKTGQVARKTGGDSTIQVDGEGAKPWLILRRLKESGAEGDIRTRVRLDTTFARRVEKPSGRFSAGQRLANGAIAWEYADSGAEQQLVGVIATGSELLAFEVVSQGLTDGEARRTAREAARALIDAAAADPVKGEPLRVLEGWNVGTMGRD